MKSLSLAFFTLSAAALVVLATGCESSTERRAHMQEARKPMPPMAAHDTFFAGKIAAHLTLGSAFAGRAKIDDESVDDSSRHSRGSGGGRGGMGGGGGMRGGGHREASADDSSSDAAPTRARFSSRAMPPIVLRLQLQDKTTYPITVEIREVNSALGNFAVRPDQLSLAPGQPTETEPMSSTLGADSSELPVTVTLRVGGQSETKVLTLHPVENQTP